MRLKSKIFNFKFLILNSREDGLTLIEVLIALTILAVGLLGVALMQVTSISGGMFSREMTTATELGQDLVERLKTLQYTSIATDNALIAGSHPDSTDVTNGLAVGAGSANITDERGQTAGPRLYTRTWTVGDNAAGSVPTSNMKTITVTVGWSEKGTSRSIAMSAVKVRE